jgi:hypothetical protein
MISIDARELRRSAAQAEISPGARCTSAIYAEILCVSAVKP